LISSQDIFTISGAKQFEKIALKVFRFQYENNAVYRSFCDLIKTEKGTVKSLEQIPFLPIQFFKSHEVVTSKDPIQETFTSSGTTGMITSKHLITDVTLYEQSYQNAFSEFYGNIEDYAVLALLPSYLERELDASGQNIILIGVTYALLDLIEIQKFQLKNTIIMETGGMKGKRKEIIREELHAILCDGFGVSSIHSEYGMTELLSQAYSLGNGIFECPSWMNILIRDPEDALSYVAFGKTGGINVIDLANINSCSFIATQDLGKKYPNNSFEVLGRFDNSDIRGCNLMVY
jgi:hypothetical protein